jgi:hypothetical protein
VDSGGSPSNRRSRDLMDTPQGPKTGLNCTPCR